MLLLFVFCSDNLGSNNIAVVDSGYIGLGGLFSRSFDWRKGAAVSSEAALNDFFTQLNNEREVSISVAEVERAVQMKEQAKAQKEEREKMNREYAAKGQCANATLEQSNEKAQQQQSSQSDGTTV